MKSYWFSLVNEDSVEFPCYIPDGNDPKEAEARARKWMEENNVPEAQLLVIDNMNSDILYEIDIEVELF